MHNTKQTHKSQKVKTWLLLGGAIATVLLLKRDTAANSHPTKP